MQKQRTKKSEKYLSNMSWKWILLLSSLAIIIVGSLLYQQSKSSKVLGISTTIYKNCSFWDIICPIRNFFLFSDENKNFNYAKHMKEYVTPTPDITATPSASEDY